MQPNSANWVLGTVCGAAVGALIGLALIKVVGPLCIPIGAVAGGVIGLAIGSSSGPYARGYSSGPDVEDVASTGCMILGCLGDLSCLGCGTLALTVLGGTLALIVR